MGISNKDGCLFKRFEFIFPNFAVQEFSAKLRVDSEEFTSNTTKEGQEMCKIKDQQTHLKKKKSSQMCQPARQPTAGGPRQQDCAAEARCTCQVSKGRALTARAFLCSSGKLENYPVNF